jgi:hypothetical protein
MLNSIQDLQVCKAQFLLLFDTFFLLLSTLTFQNNLFQPMIKPIQYCIIFLVIFQRSLYSLSICKGIIINKLSQELLIMSSYH